jgi:hypothetical protein
MGTLLSRPSRQMHERQEPGGDALGVEVQWRPSLRRGIGSDL